MESNNFIIEELRRILQDIEELKAKSKKRSDQNEHIYTNGFCDGEVKTFTVVAKSIENFIKKIEQESDTNCRK